MLEISKTSLPFTGESLDIDEYRSIEDTSPKTKVVIQVNKEVVRYMKSGRKYYGFVSEEDFGDKVQMTFMTRDSMHGLARWFMMFGDCAEIIEPDSFRWFVGEMVDKIKANLQVGANQFAREVQVD